MNNWISIGDACKLVLETLEKKRKAHERSS